MITKFNESWRLFKASIAITLQHRKLLWFPVLTTFLTVFIALFFLSAMVLPWVMRPTGDRLNQKQRWEALKAYYVSAPVVHSKSTAPVYVAVPDAGLSSALRMLFTGHYASVDRSGHPVAASRFPWDPIYLVAVYLVSMFLATFFNVAFYSEIIAALNGRGVSFRRGLSTARGRLPSILAWSLLAGVVGWIIRAIEQKLPLAGRIVTGFIGMAWSVAAVFAIPVIIKEQPMRNPIKILQQSALTLKRTWGEGIIGYLGFSAGAVVVFAFSLVPLALAGLLALLFQSVWLIIIAGTIWMLGLLFMAYISNVSSHVYRCALFLYATEGVVPEPYNQEMLNMAWKVKKTSGKP